MNGTAVRAMAISAAQVNRRRPASNSDLASASMADVVTSIPCVAGSIESPELPSLGSNPKRTASSFPHGEGV